MCGYFPQTQDSSCREPSPASVLTPISHVLSLRPSCAFTASAQSKEITKTNHPSIAISHHSQQTHTEMSVFNAIYIVYTEQIYYSYPHIRVSDYQLCVGNNLCFIVIIKQHQKSVHTNFKEGNLRKEGSHKRFQAHTNTQCYGVCVWVAI